MGKMEKKPKKEYKKKEIDWELVEKLASIMCTQEEIAYVVGVSVDTLSRRKEFAEVIKKGQAKGKASLRRMQWKSAENGNATMQIWLGKQWLGQVEKQEINTDGSITINIIRTIVDNPNEQKPKP